MEERIKAKEIVIKVLDCMHNNLEEVYKATYAPARYIVHLHPDDYDRLEGLFSKIKEGIAQALQDELDALNRGAQPKGLLTGKLARLGLRQIDEMTYERAGPQWNIEIQADAQEEIFPGSLIIESFNDLDSQSDNVSGGGRTIRVVERHTASGTSRSREVIRNDSAPQRIYARISYRDENGLAVYEMTKPLIKIGRGKRAYATDLTLNASEDISREHLHIRYNETSRQFEIKDLSTLGTKVNNVSVRKSVGIDKATNEKKYMDLWDPLPFPAQIVLADLLVLEFAGVTPT